MISESSRSDARMDPVAVLNDQCMIQILSFVWGGKSEVPDSPATGESQSHDKKLLSSVAAHEVFASYCQLLSLSRGWKTLLEKVTVQCVPDLDVDFGVAKRALPSFESYSNWLIRHKFSIQRLAILTTAQKLAPKILEHCDTDRMISCVLALRSIGDQHHQGNLMGTQLLDMMDCFPKKCPMLSEVAICFTIAGGNFQVGNIFTSSLFSLHSIKDLVLILDDCCTDDEIDFLDTMSFSKAIQNMASLKRLTVMSKGTFLLPSADGAPQESSVFRLRSTSLEELVVDKLFEDSQPRVFLLSLDCPRLQRVACKANLVE